MLTFRPVVSKGKIAEMGEVGGYVILDFRFWILDFRSRSIQNPKSKIQNGVDMPISARNQFAGVVASVKHGAVMSEVVVDIGGGHRIVSLISASSARRLK